MKSQSIKILGSVDFLGNPVGLLTDVASGVTGLIAVQPDVVGLVRDVAHGMSDTTSKVGGTHKNSVFCVSTICKCDNREILLCELTIWHNLQSGLGSCASESHAELFS